HHLEVRPDPRAVDEIDRSVAGDLVCDVDIPVHGVPNARGHRSASMARACLSDRVVSAGCEQRFAECATILCMKAPTLKVVVSRPNRAPASPSPELRRPDFCWTTEGEALGLPIATCCEADICGCGRAFVGLSSAKAVTWGVVEVRTLASV